MLEIHASGTPYEIGHTHGRLASPAIRRSIAFYTWQFQSTASLTWAQVLSLASDFDPIIRSQWPAYHAEMQGIADGADLSLCDIIAINVRTEITFGLFSDGCTALSWKTTGTKEGVDGDGATSWLAQNWDWNPRQQENLVRLTISQPSKPTIQMITEAGLLGKIGLNSSGVGVCLNAIKARGVDNSRLPVHLGLRLVLESQSRDEAVANLERFGVAAACHMLIADAENGGIGLEWSSKGVRKVLQNEKQQVFHANHYLLEHEAGVQDTNWLEDSGFRVGRIEELCKGIEEEKVSKDSLYEVFKDTANWPGAICRSAEGQSTSATLFNIIMDLGKRRADVTVGRPTEPSEVLSLEFGKTEKSGKL